MSDDACLTYTLAAVALVGGVGAGLYAVAHLAPLAAYLIAINLGALLIYRYDKWAPTREGAQRAPNLFLAGLALAGGALGALFGIYMEVLPRGPHKTGLKYLWLRLIVAFSLLAYTILLGTYLLVGGEALLGWAQGLLGRP